MEGMEGKEVGREGSERRGGKQVYMEGIYNFTVDIL